MTCKFQLFHTSGKGIIDSTYLALSHDQYQNLLISYSSDISNRIKILLKTNLNDVQVSTVSHLGEGNY